MVDVPDVDTFDRYLAELLDAALDAEVDPSDLEMVLQARAQEMRELDDWQRQQGRDGE